MTRWVDGGDWPPQWGSSLARQLGEVYHNHAVMVALLDSAGLSTANLLTGVDAETQWHHLCHRFHGQGKLGHLVDRVLTDNPQMPRLLALVTQPAPGPPAPGALAPGAPIALQPNGSGVLGAVTRLAGVRGRRATFDVELNRWERVAGTVPEATAARLREAGLHLARLAVVDAAGRAVARWAGLVTGGGLVLLSAARCPPIADTAELSIALAMAWAVVLAGHEVARCGLPRSIGRSFSGRSRNRLTAAVSAAASVGALTAVRAQHGRWVWWPWDAFGPDTAVWRQGRALAFGGVWATDGTLLVLATLLGVGALVRWRRRRDLEIAVAAPLVDALEAMARPGALAAPDARRRIARNLRVAAAGLEHAVRARLPRAAGPRVLPVYEGCRRRADWLVAEAELLEAAPARRPESLVVQVRALLAAVVDEDFEALAVAG